MLTLSSSGVGSHVALVMLVESSIRSKRTPQNNTRCKTKNEEMYSNFADLHDKDKLPSCILTGPGRFEILI